MIGNLAREAGLGREADRREVRSTEGEGDREGTHLFRTDPIALTFDASRLASVRFAAQPPARA